MSDYEDNYDYDNAYDDDAGDDQYNDYEEEKEVLGDIALTKKVL